jgi:hypothetical protein
MVQLLSVIAHGHRVPTQNGPHLSGADQGRFGAVLRPSVGGFDYLIAAAAERLRSTLLSRSPHPALRV